MMRILRSYCGKFGTRSTGLRCLPSWRRPSFVFPSVSVATTILIFIFHRPRPHCISKSYDIAMGGFVLPPYTVCRRRSPPTNLSRQTNHGTASRPRFVTVECLRCDFVTFHLGWLLDHSLVVQGWLPRHGCHEAFFLQHGLPAWLAWFVVSFEVVIAVCLVLGIYVSLLCLVSLPILFVSMWIYRGNGFYFSSGGIELPTFWACAQIAQVLLGPGAFRIRFRHGLPHLPAGFGMGF